MTALETLNYHAYLPGITSGSWVQEAAGGRRGNVTQALGGAETKNTGGRRCLQDTRAGGNQTDNGEDHRKGRAAERTSAHKDRQQEWNRGTLCEMARKSKPEDTRTEPA